MPRARHAQGRPGTAVIPADWEATHAPVAEKTQTAAISLRHPGTTQAWNPVTEQNEAVPLAPYFTGTCRVQALATSARDVVAAEDPETIAAYLITVPASVAPVERDLATVTASGDLVLDDQVLVVEQVVRGSLRFERDLFCTLTG